MIDSVDLRVEVLVTEAPHRHTQEECGPTQDAGEGGALARWNRCRTLETFDERTVIQGELSAYRDGQLDSGGGQTGKA
jgi:hypothetical protein